jgi:hypothetical protein
MLESRDNWSGRVADRLNSRKNFGCRTLWGEAVKKPTAGCPRFGVQNLGLGVPSGLQQVNRNQSLPLLRVIRPTAPRPILWV